MTEGKEVLFLQTDPWKESPNRGSGPIPFDVPIQISELDAPNRLGPGQARWGMWEEGT